MREAVALKALEWPKAVCIFVAVALAGNAWHVGHAAVAAQIVQTAGVVAEAADRPHMPVTLEMWTLYTRQHLQRQKH